MGCFGLVQMWHRHVLGIEVETWPTEDLQDGFAARRGCWQEVNGIVPARTCFLASRDGIALHCGVCVDAGRAIHSAGSEDRFGSVKLAGLSALQRMYGGPKAQFRLFMHKCCLSAGACPEVPTGGAHG